MNVITVLLGVLLKFLYFLSQPIFWWKNKNNTKKIIKINNNNNQLLNISATKLAEKIRNRQISSEEVCEAYIKKIKEVNQFLNAVIEDRFEEALKEAKNVDVYLNTCSLSPKELEKIKPLLGVPLTVKESCSLAGLSLSGGTLGRTGIKADQDGEVIKRLKTSGAIPLLVSNTPELCLSWESTNFITGTTNNPYDTTRTSSGSSGGEGALLGAGASVIGVGSDIAGSIRLPALFNGIFGHKPTPGIIPIKGHYPYCIDPKFSEFLVIGPMTRYAEDLKLMVKNMAFGEKVKELKLNENVDLSKIKIFYMEEASQSIKYPPVDEEIKLVICKAINYLKNNCNSQIVDDYKFPDLENSLEIAGSVLYTVRDIPDLLKGDNNQHLVIEILKSFLGLSKYTFNLLLFYFMQYLYKNLISNENHIRKNQFLKTLFTELLGNDGVFIFPTFPIPAFKHNSLFFWSTGIAYLMIVNTLGLPATHVPCGLNKQGLPIGFQVIAAPNQDRLCLAVAEELEKCFGGWVPPF